MIKPPSSLLSSVEVSVFEPLVELPVASLLEFDDSEVSVADDSVESSSESEPLPVVPETCPSVDAGDAAMRLLRSLRSILLGEGPTAAKLEFMSSSMLDEPTPFPSLGAPSESVWEPPSCRGSLRLPWLGDPLGEPLPIFPSGLVVPCSFFPSVSLAVDSAALVSADASVDDDAVSDEDAVSDDDDPVSEDAADSSPSSPKFWIDPSISEGLLIIT